MKYFRPNRVYARWEGFFSVVLSWEGKDSPNQWGWTSKGFMLPSNALKFAVERVASPEIRHASIYFHPHPWTKGILFRVVDRDGSVKKQFTGPCEPPEWFEARVFDKGVWRLKE